MMDIPKVSVIIPTYNRSEYLVTAIESVRSQTYAGWELLVIDDGSVDNTREVVANLSDARIRYFYQENHGSAAARNAGLLASRGELIAFLDSDDQFLPCKLETQVDALTKDKSYGLVYGLYNEIDSRGQVLRQGGKCFRQLSTKDFLLGWPFGTSTVMLRREWAMKVGLFDETLPLSQDWDYWIRLSIAGCVPTCIDKVIINYRVHDGNISRKLAALESATMRVLEKAFANPDLSESLQEVKGLSFALMNLRLFALALQAHNSGQSNEYLSKALLYEPRITTSLSHYLIDAIVGAAMNSGVLAKQEFVEFALHCLPAQINSRSIERSLNEKFLLAQAFQAYDMNDLDTAKTAALTAISTNPMNILNKGVVSVLLHSILRS